MSRKHKRLVEYFISVGIDENVAPINDDIMSNPIRSLKFISEKEMIPDGYDILDSTITGRDGAIIKKGLINSIKYYLCFSRITNNDTFSLLNFDKIKNVDRKIWNRVEGGCKIVQNQTEYCLSTRLESTMTPVVDICLISQENKEECPNNYIPMNWNINGLTLCCRHMPLDALELRYQTCIIDRFPFIDYPSSPLSNTTAVFCQPNGASILDKPFMPTFLSFVLTDSEGEKMYASTVTFCDEMNNEMFEKLKRTNETIYTSGFQPKFPENIKQLYYTRSVCILSYYPFFSTFKECLKEIYRVANSPGNIPIERYIINLCIETPLPIANVRGISLTLAHKPIVFKLPGEDECHLLDLDLEKLFSCLDINNIITIFRALISQNFKIVVASNHISLITSIMEGLVSFLMPFEWQFTYVPVLPYSVFGILDAPLSVLVGMHSSRLRPDFYRNDREIVICDLDTNTVHVPSSVNLIEIPSNLQKNLRHNLKHMANGHKVERYDHSNTALIDAAFAAKIKDETEVFDSQACRLCFLLFWIKLFGPNYRDFLEFPDETVVYSVKDLFKVDEFIASRPKNQKKFWTELVETQGFERFVNDETYPQLEARKYQLLFFANLAKQYNELEMIYTKQAQQDSLTKHFIAMAQNLPKLKEEEINNNIK